MSCLKFSKVFRRTNWADPPVFTVEFTGQLPKDRMLEPQEAEFTYDPATGPGASGKYDLKKVKYWTIDKSIAPEVCEHGIVETEGNHIKVRFRLKNEKGWCPIMGDSEHMNMRVHAYAHMTEDLTEYVGTKRSNVYHNPDCYIAKRIKEPIKISETEMSKRRLCRKETG